MTNPYNPYDPNAQQPQFNAGYGAGMPGGGMPKPENYLIWTILSTIMCCLPLGAVGIYYSLQVDKSWELGQIAEAEANAQRAKKLAIASAAVTAIGMVLYVAFIVFTVVLSASTGTSSY